MGRRALSIAVWIAVAAPALAIAGRAAFGDLGANPVETLEHATGDAAIRLLLATLAVTPLRRIAGWHAIGRFRRRLGLAAFAYVSVHFTLWAGIDNGFDPATIGEDIVERPYVTVGFTAFVLLTPLALTSTRAAMRRLGKRWISLHRLIYPAAALAVLHYLWLVKKDLVPPLRYAAVLGVLLAARAWLRLRSAERARAGPHIRPS